MNRHVLIIASLGLLALGGAGYAWLGGRSATDAPAAAPALPAGVLSAGQVARLGIRFAQAARADAVPLGTVPGQVSLPPEARVAVTAPFAGVAVRVLVIEWQQVVRGQPLAVVRAAQPVQFGADLARAQADLAVQQAEADRLAMLASKGVVAGARADEARAALSRTQVTIAENRRLLALGGAARDGTATLRAPLAGRVAKVSVETGGPVGGEMAPFVIENTGQLALDLQLPQRLAGTVRPGMAVSVSPGGDAPAVSGRVLSVSASLDPVTRSIPAKASLPAGAALVPGQGVMAVIADAVASGRVGTVVPEAAVTRIDGRDHVFVRQRDPRGIRLARRAVTVVANAGGNAVLADGLRPGEVVAVSGVAELKSIAGGE